MKINSWTSQIWRFRARKRPTTTICPLDFSSSRSISLQHMFSQSTFVSASQREEMKPGNNLSFLTRKNKLWHFFPHLMEKQNEWRIHRASTLVLMSLASSTLTCSPVEPEDEPALLLVEGIRSWFCCSILVLVHRLMDCLQLSVHRIRSTCGMQHVKPLTFLVLFINFLDRF